MGNNAIKQLPDEITMFSKLVELGFPQNDIKKLPSDMDQMRSLESLSLPSNRLSGLPDSIVNVPNLAKLYVSQNVVEELPAGIENLVQLENLYLDNNSLHTLPDSICLLSNLQSLNIEKNPFESLPPCLQKFDGIESFTIESEKRMLFMDFSYKPSNTVPKLELEHINLRPNPADAIYRELAYSLDNAHLSKYKSFFLGEARNAVRITTTSPHDYTQLGVSRLGGFPDLPRFDDYPKTDNLYWSFLAQFNLAELPEGIDYLPKAGLLSFFIDSTEYLNAKVLFSEGDLDQLVVPKHGGSQAIVDEQDDYSEYSYNVDFKRFVSNTFRPPDEMMAIHNDILAFESWRESHEHHPLAFNSHHYDIYELPQQKAADKYGGYASEWVPLLNLGPDDNVGFNFWDAATLVFCVHQEDLRRYDFYMVHISLINIG